MKRALLLASLLFPALPAAGACTQAGPPPVVDPVASEFDALAKEYAEAAGEHAKKGPAKPGADPKALPHPAIAFYPRFAALAEKGEGRALLWMANRMQSAHPDRTKVENLEAAWKLVERVATEYADRPWIGAWASGVTALYVDFGAARVDPLVDRFAAQCTHSEAVGEALYRAREEARRLKNAERAKALEAQIARDFPDTKYGKRLRAPEVAADAGPFTPAIGKVAQDFTTQDADGIEFKLSDYRGKVVVLDFWGFW